MSENLFTNFSNLKEYSFDYYSLRNIRMMELTDADWERLIKVMERTYGMGVSREDLNAVFDNENINLVREWLGKPHVEDDVYPKYYRLTSKIKGKQLDVEIWDDQIYGEVLMDNDFLGCKPKYLGTKKPSEEVEAIVFVNLEKFKYDEDMMWNKYDIPTYAVNEICRLIHDPDGTLDYYPTPDTFALNELNRNVELTNRELSVINRFIKKLNKDMPDGFDIDWDDDSCASPSFSPYPEFGLGMDCVILRVYPKNINRLEIGL